MGPFVPDFFHLTYYIQGIFTQHVSELHSFLRLDNILLCDYTTFCLSVCQLTVMGVVLYILLDTSSPSSLPKIAFYSQPFFEGRHFYHFYHSPELLLGLLMNVIPAQTLCSEYH